ncbi:B3 domain-containing protein REM21-like [Apium graveolens]|uniref:B3 domain-containing protein REM21-like n=1 Tax=Apium graveolens TaxID=4045 RepID=UPI003D7AD814
MAPVQNQIPLFFKCFNGEDRNDKMDLPKSWCSYVGRSLPCEAILRNMDGDSWQVKIAHDQSTDEFWFEQGWRTFAEQNKLDHNDNILFMFDGASTFDIELFDEYGDVKECMRIRNSEEEKRIEQLEFESMLCLGEQGNMPSESVESESQLQQPRQLEPETEERQDMQLDQEPSV